MCHPGLEIQSSISAIGRARASNWKRHSSEPAPLYDHDCRASRQVPEVTSLISNRFQHDFFELISNYCVLQCSRMPISFNVIVVYIPLMFM